MRSVIFFRLLPVAPAKLVLGEAERNESLDSRLHHGLRFVDQAGPGPCRLADVGSGAVLQFEDSFVLQLPVGANDRVGVHHQVLGDLADGGELIAFVESPGFHCVLHLLHKLEVEGNARGWIESKDHDEVC